jgi:hypothetical protein
MWPSHDLCLAFYSSNCPSWFYPSQLLAAVTIWPSQCGLSGKSAVHTSFFLLLSEDLASVIESCNSSLFLWTESSLKRKLDTLIWIHETHRPLAKISDCFSVFYLLVVVVVLCVYVCITWRDPLSLVVLTSYWLVLSTMRSPSYCLSLVPCSSPIVFISMVPEG